MSDEAAAEEADGLAPFDKSEAKFAWLICNMPRQDGEKMTDYLAGIASAHALVTKGHLPNPPDLKVVKK